MKILKTKSEFKVIVICEESQEITEKYRKAGIECYSNDLKPAKINKKWHIQGSCFDIDYSEFQLVIAHPPCTYLSVTGNKWFKPEFVDRFPDRINQRAEAIEFFMKIVSIPVKYICVENPVGIMSSLYKKPDQIIQPYYFGDAESKRTCLWLKNLPKLKHSLTDNLFEKKTHVEPDIITFKSGKTMSRFYYEASKFNAEIRSEMRSKTFEGIAKAIVNQWNPKTLS